MLKFDLHVHTCYSFDGVTTLKEVIAYSKKKGLHGIAITDHNSNEGALKLVKCNDIICIPGVEVSTIQGHVLALNVTESIPANGQVDETIEIIHEAGGIAIAAHPTSVYREGLGTRTVSRYKFDAIEVMNSGAFPFFLSTYLNRRLATHLRLPQTGGSDSHIPETIGMAYTVIDSDGDIEEIVNAIRRGKTLPQGKGISWVTRIQTVYRKKHKENR